MGGGGNEVARRFPRAATGRVVRLFVCFIEHSSAWPTLGVVCLFYSILSDDQTRGEEERRDVPDLAAGNRT